MDSRNIAGKVAQFYNAMYDKRWIKESGGGVSLRSTDGNLVYSIPSYTAAKFSVSDRQVLEQNYVGFETDMCAGLFKLPFEKFNANAIAHTHSTNALVVSQWAGQRELITWSNNQIIKSIYDRGMGYLGLTDTVQLRLMNDVEDLEGRMITLLANDSSSSAVLVRGHGLFVWDTSIEGVFKQCHAYEDLFELAVKEGRAQFDHDQPRE